METILITLSSIVGVIGMMAIWIICNELGFFRVPARLWRQMNQAVGNGITSALKTIITLPFRFAGWLLRQLYRGVRAAIQEMRR